MSASFYSGFTTQLLLLACHPIAAAGLALRPDIQLGPLQMVDQEGRPAVAFRVWRSEAVDSEIAGSVYRLRGCEPAHAAGLSCRLVTAGRIPPYPCLQVAPRSGRVENLAIRRVPLLHDCHISISDKLRSAGDSRGHS